MENSPSVVLLRWAEKLEQTYPGLVANLPTSSPQDRGTIRIALYFYHQDMPHFHYRLLYFEQAIDSDEEYGFEIIAFRSEDNLGKVDSAKSFEQILDDLLVHTRTKRVIEQITTISRASEQSFQA